MSHPPQPTAGRSSPVARVVEGPMVAGEPAADRLMASVAWRIPQGCPPISRDQVALVLHALADHAALEAARTYRRASDQPGDFHPTSTAIGRWLHDTADQLTDPAAQPPSEPTAGEHPAPAARVPAERDAIPSRQNGLHWWADPARHDYRPADPDRPEDGCRSCGHLADLHPNKSR